MRCEGSCSVVELSCSARSREDMIVGFCVGSHGELLLDNESTSRESFIEGTSTLLSLLSPSPDSRLSHTDGLPSSSSLLCGNAETISKRFSE